MTEIAKNPIDKKLDFLSGYQMLGGLMGLAFIVYLIFQIDEINPGHILIFGLGILVYTFSFISGLFLFQRRHYGLKLSLINQILQIIGFSCWGFGFEYVAGLSFDILIKYINGMDFTTSFGLSNWHILINGESEIQEISINLIALFLVFFILRLRREYNLYISTSDIASIGT